MRRYLTPVWFALMILTACVLLTPIREVLSAPIQTHKQHKVIHARVVKHFDTIVFTPQTVFSLNGTNCDYETVPQSAVPILVRLAPDGTVLEVQFRKVGRER